MKILALNGSYRRGGIIDTAIAEILEAARESGAETDEIRLIDEQIAFCTNCRTCTQEAGIRRGQCVIDDAMKKVLAAVEEADAIVLGSPMNFGTVTAVTKRFLERLVCFAYWPWGKLAPKMRDTRKRKNAVVVASSMSPFLMGRFSKRYVGVLKEIAGILGARTRGVVYVGLAARGKRQGIGVRAGKRARAFGKKLASAASR
jgi:multimeric flavodoxin WrbA